MERSAQLKLGPELAEDPEASDERARRVASIISEQAGPRSFTDTLVSAATDEAIDLGQIEPSSSIGKGAEVWATPDDTEPED